MRAAPSPFPQPIFVTRPTLPAKERFIAQLDEIWESRILSNQGPKHDQLEALIGRTLKHPQVKLFCNGTLALTLTLQAMGIKGEVLTTPFTFPATPHAIQLAGARPVFCDIDARTLCIDPAKIEAMIGPDTEAILGVHVYGIPCDVEAIELIAKKHGLKVIYDAAHAFMTEVGGRPISSFGDATMFSFHATKLFHTVEGGCVAYRDSALGPTLSLLRNFGILNEDTVLLAGTNAKLNELQCAMGIEMLGILDEERRARARLKELYSEALSELPGLECLLPPAEVSDSLQYMAVRVNEADFGMSRDDLYAALKDWNIFSRRYFHPLCSDFEFYRNLRRSDLSEARRAATEVLCLPLYGELPVDAAERIVHILAHLHRSATASPLRASN